MTAEFAIQKEIQWYKIHSFDTHIFYSTLHVSRQEIVQSASKLEASDDFFRRDTHFL